MSGYCLLLLKLQRCKPGTQMFVAYNLSRATLAVKEEMTDNFQVFALELELTPFDFIKVSPIQKG